MNMDKFGNITELKLCDFGMSCFSGGSGVDEQHIGTEGYQAPEFLMGDTIVDCKFDSWSLGIILFNLVTGSMPFNGSSQNIIQKTINHEPYFNPSQWDKCSPELINLMQGLLAKEPLERLDLRSVM